MRIRRWLACCVVIAVQSVCSRLACAQDFTVEPQGSFNAYAYCTDQFGNLVTNCDVSITNGYYYNTGGHIHNTSRPSTYYGHLSNSGGNTGPSGYLPFTFSSSTVGGDEWIEVCAFNGCKDGWVRVAYTDLATYGGSGTNTLVGATTVHPDNHYGTPQLTSAISSITGQYATEFSCYGTYQTVGVNDMALPYGGVFDLNQNWQPPHASHQRGKAVDFRERAGTSNSVIPDPFVIQEFLNICRANGLAFAIQENAGTSNEHIHCATNGSGT